MNSNQIAYIISYSFLIVGILGITYVIFVQDFSIEFVSLLFMFIGWLGTSMFTIKLADEPNKKK